MSRLQAALTRRKRSAARRLALTADLLGRHCRRTLLAAGGTIPKPYLVLRGSEKDDYCGLFSELTAVLGLLEHYEEWRDIYAGLQVDFADQGLYYEPACGENWWQYFFEPIALGRRDAARPRIVNAFEHEKFSCAVALLPRARAAELVSRYVHPRPHLLAKVAEYVGANFGNAYVIGVHYRGTDKHEDAPRLPYENIRAAMLAASAAAGERRHRFFIATDERAFLDYVIAEFPGKLLYRDIYRSANGRAIDVANADGNCRKGEDAVLDCLLLSRCQTLVRTASNLSLCSTLFNPRLPELALSRER